MNCTLRRMAPIDLISPDVFDRETSCTYRGETYRVRDNGALWRHGRFGKRRRPLDERWTFGKLSKTDGYMSISGHKVHRIVATAFHGEQPSKGHVVDHIDTNRRNNRPENLRWVTRLENVLLNPITAKRVIFLYGSIEVFLADPRNPRNGDLSPDFEWMRTVTAEEAERSRNRMLAWAASEGGGRGGSLGDWVFRRGGSAPDPEPDPRPDLVASETPGAVQRNWRVPATFPLCPDPADLTPLETYADRLRPGEVAVVTRWGQTVVDSAAPSEDGTAIYLIGDHGDGAPKRWSLARITHEDGQLVHESLGTFFERIGAEKQMTLAQGLTWSGGEVFDDWC